METAVEDDVGAIDLRDITRRGLIEVWIHARAHESLDLHLVLAEDRKSTRLNSSHSQISYAVFCLKKKRTGEDVRVWSLGAPEESEAALVARFFDGIERYKPQLVSWNGSTFDLPVLNYRALIHGIAGCCYWDTGENDRDFKFNNYLSRFHSRHVDLMDVLAGYQNRAWAPLDEMARL